MIGISSTVARTAGGGYLACGTAKAAREVIAAVAFLVAPASGYITGQILEVDGIIDRPNIDLSISCL